MMSSEVLTAILAFLGTTLGSVTGILASVKLTNYRLRQLEIKVEKHNNLVERMALVEQTSRSNTKRIEALERGE